MEEHEIICNIINACAGKFLQEVCFEEAETSWPDASLRDKHPAGHARSSKVKI